MPPRAVKPAFSLFSNGARKYLNASENIEFLKAAHKQPLETELFALTLYHTGCRISEALSLRREDLDLENDCIHINTLKQRGIEKNRSIPVQRHFILKLAAYKNAGPLWTFHRTTGWRRITKIIQKAGIEDGPHACPKGLRHGYGIASVQQGVTLSDLQTWMGHSDINTTMIYLKTAGPEERISAENLWRRDVPQEYRWIYDEFRRQLESKSQSKIMRRQVDQLIEDLQMARSSMDIQNICNRFGLQEVMGYSPKPMRIRQLHEVEKENVRLKHLVAELMLKVQCHTP